MPVADFIETYDHVLSPAACTQLIERFEASGQMRRGATGSGVDLSMKDSWDIQLDSTPGWDDAIELLNNAALASLCQYLRRYPHVALAPLQLKLQTPEGTEQVLDGPMLSGMDDELLTGVIAKVFRPGAINIQKYIANQGGYPYWHSEQYPRGDHGEALHRALLWTAYLNDGFGAGETEFLYQQRVIRPKTGSLLLAPTAFTHTHRGNRPVGGHKYIATSWVLYQRAEQLFAR